MASVVERIHLSARRVDAEVIMASLKGGTTMESLTEQVESRVRETTHGRIRNLTVHEVQGRILIRGQAPTHHARQLALSGALQLLSGDQLRAKITVGKWGGGVRSTRADWIDRLRPRRPNIR